MTLTPGAPVLCSLRRGRVGGTIDGMLCREGVCPHYAISRETEELVLEGLILSSEAGNIARETYVDPGSGAYKGCAQMRR